MRSLKAAAVALCLMVGACAALSNATSNVTYADVVTAANEAEAVLRAGAEQYIALHPEDTKSAAVIHQAEQAADAALAAMSGNAVPTVPQTPQQAAQEARTALRAFVAYLPPGTLNPTATGAISIADVMLTTFINLPAQQANTMPANKTARMAVTLPAAH